MELDSLVYKVRLYRHNNGTNDDFDRKCSISYFDGKELQKAGSNCQKKSKCSVVLG